MATSPSTVEFILDQLRDLSGRVRTRKMFGEYALYCDDKVVALICDDQLFVKITEPGKEIAGPDYQEGNPYPGAKPAILIDDSVLDNPERLCRLIDKTAAIVPLPRKKRVQTSSKSS